MCFTVDNAPTCCNGVILFSIYIRLFFISINTTGSEVLSDISSRLVGQCSTNDILSTCVDLMACPTLGVRESQMLNISLTSVKMGDQGATLGKVTILFYLYLMFIW